MMLHNKKIMYFTVFLFVQYVFVTAIMMLSYHGGQHFNHEGIGFIFNQNYLSDLGRTVTFSGTENPSSIFYTLTLSLAGVGVTLFFFILNGFSNNPWRFFIMLLGVVSGIGYIGIAINPVNLSLIPHLMFGKVSFFAFFFASLGSHFLICKNTFSKSNKVFYFLNAMLFCYLLLMLFGPPSSTGLWALNLKTMAQKTMVYSMMVCTVLILINTQQSSVKT